MKPSLKSKAKENAQVTIGQANNMSTIKSGTPLALKTSLPIPVDNGDSSRVKIGVAKGVTKNMDNFESLRVDVWLEDYKQDGESIDEAYVRIGAIVDEELQNQVNSILEY